MRIEYVCSGGYGGLHLTYQCDTDTLPPAESQKILDLIAAADAFDLDPAQISSEKRKIPDDFVCRLTLTTDQKIHSLSFRELSAPVNLRRLSAHLRKLALDNHRVD